MKPARRHLALSSAAAAHAAALCLAASLAACGGGNGDAAPSAEALAESEAPFGSEALPAFHMAALALDEPAFVDDGALAASMAPHRQALAAAARGLDTARLTPDAIDAQQRRSTYAAQGGETALPAATLAGTVGTVTVYTPAQVRAAYGLPAAPANAATAGLGRAEAAALGAGQTVYIVAAKHNPNALVDLNTFNTRFGLPGCQPLTIAATAKLPLGAAAASGCSVAVVYSTTAGGMTGSAPAYDAGWASEIALDLQWAHAIAPLARVVLIEAADAGLNSLIGAVKLANAMGPGVVSMSFGAAEGSWVNGVDAVFRGAGMAYVAATGDAGAQVNWPAVSASVLAVGGTTLSYNGAARSEVAWSRTGGGTSSAVATSLSTPQWAGLLAVANAQRALAGRAALGTPHAALYRNAAGLADVSSGSNGGCGTCSARVGYDLPTGLGTPNAAALLPRLAAD